MGKKQEKREKGLSYRCPDCHHMVEKEQLFETGCPICGWQSPLKEGPAEKVIREFGFGGLLDAAKKSPAFEKRLEEANAQIKERLASPAEAKPRSRLRWNRSLSTHPSGMRHSALRAEEAKSLHETHPRQSKGPRTLNKLRGEAGKKGRVQKARKVSLGQEPTRHTELLVDVFDEDDRIRVVAQLPGLDEKNIKLKVAGDKLKISAGKYKKEIELPCRVKKTPKTSYKNGILEINMEKLK